MGRWNARTSNDGDSCLPALVWASVTPYLPGPVLARGLIWGFILWTVMEVAVMPMLGAGVFRINGPGMMGAVAALMAHLVYGGLLGWIAAGEATPALPKVARV